MSVRDEFKTVRDSKRLWQLINNFKTCKFRLHPEISIETWVGYFKNLYTPVRNSGLTFYAEPYVVDETLDSPVHMKEIDFVLGKLLDNKAPGESRIPAEFYKNVVWEYKEVNDETI